MEKIRIQIVEDEPVNASYLEMIIEEMGYIPSPVATSAKEAISIAKVFNPDLLLMDINIEGEMDGIDTAIEINKSAPTPVIFITSRSDEATFQKAKTSIPFAYITKPFDAPVLQRSIELAIQNMVQGERLNTSLEFEDSGLLIKDSFFVKVRNRLIKVKFDDIQALEVEEKYTSIILSDQRKYLVRVALSELLSKLPKQFIRTHRKYAVNIEAVKQINLGDQAIELGDITVSLGNNYKDEFLKAIKTLK